MVTTPLFDDPHLTELADALDFTPEDLSSNQKGYLTREQYERVKRKQVLSYEFVSTILRLLVLGALFFMLPSYLYTHTLEGLFVIGLWLIGTIKVNNHLMLKCYAFKRREHVFWTTVIMPNHRLLFRPSVWCEGRWVYFPCKLRRKLVPRQTYNVTLIAS
jgi:hypothetical protein